MAIKIDFDVRDGSAVVSANVKIDVKPNADKCDIERAILTAAASLLARAAECLRDNVAATLTEALTAAEAEAKAKLAAIASEWDAMKAAMSVQSDVGEPDRPNRPKPKT